MTATPFPTAEAAWFWCMRALAARRDGVPSPAHADRPCAPDSIVLALDQLYRRRRIDRVHSRILRIWGERGVAPDPHFPADRADARLWREALDRLELPLRVRGIVG